MLTGPVLAFVGTASVVLTTAALALTLRTLTPDGLDPAFIRTVAQALFLINFSCTLFLTGLIWTVQVVNYPLFAAVGRERFDAFHRGHVERITAVVAVPMFAELLSSGLLLIYRPLWIPAWGLWAGLALVLMAWVSTIFLQVPCHQRLSNQYQAPVLGRLVAGNWIRTAAWSLRSLLFASFLLAFCAHLS